MITCLWIPDFAITVTRSHDSTLRDAPLILTRKTAQKTRVYAASVQARYAGVTSGMGLARAQALCPEAQVTPVIQTHLQQAADGLLERLSLFSNRLEIEAKATAMLWVNVDTGVLSEVTRISRDLRDHLSAVAPYTVLTGIADNKFTAQIAAVTAEPAQVQMVQPGQEAAFLAPFPLARLALGGPLVYQFRLLGLETLGQFAALPRAAVYDRFGTVGKQLYARAQGDDPRPVAAYTPRLTETWTCEFEPSLADQQILEHQLRTAAATLADRLKDHNLATGHLTLLVNLDRQPPLELTHQPREAAFSVFALSTELLRLLKSAPITCSVTGLDVVLADLHEPLPYQLELFGQFFANPAHVTTIAHRLHPRHTTTELYSVCPVNDAGYIPEHAFTLERIAGT